MSKQNLSYFILLGIISLLLFFSLTAFSPRHIYFFDDFSSQLFYFLNPKEKANKDIVVVVVDEHSLKQLNNQWPMQRSLFAEALDILIQNKAKVVGFDIMLQGQSPLAQEDEKLATALKNTQGRVVLACYTRKNEFRQDELVSPLGIFRKGALLGFVNAPQDSDGKVRKLKTYVKLKDFPGFSWVMQIISAYSGASFEKKGKYIVSQNKRIPLNSDDTFIINYRSKPKDFTVVSFYNLLNRNFPAGIFKDKIVLIGASAEIIHDIVDTPLERMPGVFIKANAISAILQEKYLRSLPDSIPFIFFLATLFFAVLIIAYLGLIKGIILFAGVILALLWASIIFKFFGWQFSYGAVTVSSLVFFVMSNFLNYFKFLKLFLLIKKEMTTDPFTKLFKLRYFYERVNLEISGFPRKTYSLVLVILDGFSIFTKEKSFEELKIIWKEISSLLSKFSRLWSINGKDIIIGLKKGKIDLASLEGALKQNFFGKNIKINLKLGCMQIDFSVNPRNILPFFIEYVQKSSKDLVYLDKKQIPVSLYGKFNREDFASSLYYDAEEKNRELLDTIEKLIAEEKKTNEAYLGVISSLVNALESKDHYTEGHSSKVCRYACLLADKLNLSAQEKEKIRKASLLHDLGKIGIPDKILHKKGKLTEQEFVFMKEHEILSTKILEPIKEFSDFLPYILYHHENFDGSGYPHGLAGDFIPLGARIIAIADVFDALTTGRDYRDAYSVKEAVDELMKMKGKRLDPHLVDVFMEILKEYHSQIFKG